METWPDWIHRGRRRGGGGGGRVTKRDRGEGRRAAARVGRGQVCVPGGLSSQWVHRSGH